VQREANLDDGAGLTGKVSADAPGKRVLSGRCVLAGGETGSFRRQWEHCRPIPAETLAGSDRPAYTGVGSGVKTEIPVYFLALTPQRNALAVRELFRALNNALPAPLTISRAPEKSGKQKKIIGGYRCARHQWARFGKSHQPS
jgi:hypothetical protein